MRSDNFLNLGAAAIFKIELLYIEWAAQCCRR
jgi:hypothetical protein